MLEESDCQGGHAENGSFHSSTTMDPARTEITELLPQEGVRNHERRADRVERMISRIKEWLSEFRPHLVAPLRFVFNWIAILTLPVWGGLLATHALWGVRKEKDVRDAFAGRKWIGEL